MRWPDRYLYGLAFLTAFSGATLTLSVLAAPDAATPARNQFGQPDMQGFWSFASVTPLQRPEHLADKEFMTVQEAREFEQSIVTARQARFEREPDGLNIGYNDFWDEWGDGVGDNLRTSIIVSPANGRIPPLSEGAVLQRSSANGDVPSQRPARFLLGGISKDGPEDRGLSERCLVGFNTGPPMLPSKYNNNMQLLQFSDHVVIVTEMIHDARIIPLDGRPHADPAITQWGGNARGHWQGDTLVVHTRNFTDKIASLSQPYAAWGSAENMQLEERFTLNGNGSLVYEFTINDPATFVEPIKGILHMRPSPDRIYEYACHEGNYALPGILAGARQAETR
ncbi:hypothetical protein [Pseudohongiella sp.]|uniref:Uncharacterized protein n=1 Tax=marine sediment metagenome TaxID=412755 RepID=A0A0F9XIN5_9ZZZZ|nr:hypothetical protein [Pseudohongiella sp.]HDZ08951.1 hypothetical protein [Pseudohongiella sp.]HEA63971.1 hypothetical protein [Pseudohongiella sp.]